MAAKKPKKEKSWDEIGQTIGGKIDKEFKNRRIRDQCSTWHWHARNHGLGFGRFVFIFGALYAMHYAGWLVSIPIWVLIIIGAGFTLMRF
jgi:hypothetical protein